MQAYLSPPVSLASQESLQLANNQASFKSRETCHVITAITDISVLSDQDKNVACFKCFNKAAIQG